MLSIVIPTWNNLDYVKLCVSSIRKNSVLGHQVILHVNDGSDGTLTWARQQGLDHTHSPTNIGICLAINEAASLAREDFILYMNDDMYCCPGWDQMLLDRVKSIGHDLFMLSSTLIEPNDSNNPCISVADYGRDVGSFQEQVLLDRYRQHVRPDWWGSTWPPNVVSRKRWFSVGGFSSEFSPGLCSDNDFSMKMWMLGCRVFLGVGNSMVYHFSSKSTGRIVLNQGHLQFLHKWGITSSTFDRFYLHSGRPATGDTLPQPQVEALAFKWHHWRSYIKRRLAPHPLVRSLL